jgi:biopolymer transport protein ExbB/TolQ
MNNITIFEFVLVGIIIIIQTVQAIKTRGKIKALRFLIPNLSFFKIEKYNIPFEDLQSFQPTEILNDLSVYKDNSNIVEVEYSEDEELESDLFSANKPTENKLEFKNEISLINPSDKSNPIFESLLHSINVYLLRNKGATTDFNLIKDITERNIDTEDDDISQTITIPLYLGLMGTMLGIIFGLINLFIVSDNGANFEIQGFLGGVSIAMFASFYGLGWTVYNSSFNYKSARKTIEKAKNNFYTFIQTELLPILNQSVSSSVYMLHTNLVKFNDNFTININRLSGLLNKNYDAVIAQDSILQNLEKIDITEFAKANVKVLKELKKGTEDLHKFNQYLSVLNLTVDGTTKLSHSFEDLLGRINHFEGLAEKLDSRIEESNKLVQFLNDHYQLLSERSDLINDSVKKVDDVLIKSLVDLQDHTNTKIDAIKEITIKEEDLLTKAFAENRSHFSKLSLLVDLNKAINEIKLNSNVQINSVNNQISLLKESFDNTNKVLAQMNNRSLIHKTQNVANSIKNIFTSKKKLENEKEE